MPVKTFGTPVPFNDYAWKNMNDTIAKGLTFGITSVQDGYFQVIQTELDAFANGAMSQLSAAITNYAGMTLKYALITWDQTPNGQDENGQETYIITNLHLGFVVHVDTTGNGYNVVNALDYPDWFHNFTLYVNTESWSAYLLDPCPTGYHWDAAAGGCIPDTCPTGYHWDTDTQQCVKDTATNCPIGTKWDATQGKCVVDSTPPPDEGGGDGKKFPWIYVLLGVAGITVSGGIIYYFVKRKKKRSAPQNTMPNYLE
jgi:hypothetical protein